VARILVVEDSSSALELVERALGVAHEVIAARSLEEARQLSARETFELALVDLSLPDGSGFAFCSELQADPTHRRVPVLFLTASDQVADKVMAFQLGADDFIQKPFAASELRARAEARLRKSREHHGAAETIRIGDLHLDLARFQARAREGELARCLDLTPHEFRLLHHLAMRRDQVVTRESLLETLWRPVVVSPRTINTHVSNLRAKLHGLQVRIEAVRGIGYRLRIEGHNVKES
jgi:DNA-binding response OmpR family regulator